jgi:acyl carrier protein
VRRIVTLRTSEIDDYKELIRQFIWTNYVEGKYSVNLDNATRLRTSGLVDSLAAMGLIGFLEKRFDVEFSALDLTVDNFDTVDQIASLIFRKRQ